MKHAQRSTLRRASIAAAVAVLAICGTGAFAGSAQATNYDWCHIWLGPNTWCGPTAQIHTFGLSRANGPGGVILCSKLVKPSDHSYNYARLCQSASSVTVYSDGGGRAPYPNNSVDMLADVANGDNPYTSFTVDGHAEY